MSKHLENITNQNNYNGLAINTNENKGLACRTDVLNHYQAHLNDMIKNHSKVIQIRFDCHYPADNSIIPQNEHISDFQCNVRKALKRDKNCCGHDIDPRFTIVKEQHNNSINPHYHGVLLLNANAKQRYFPIIKTIEKQWKNIIKSEQEGLVDYCNTKGQNGIIINRNYENFEENKNKCSYQASYLAKERGKENRCKGEWPVLGTRVPKKNV